MGKGGGLIPATALGGRLLPYDPAKFAEAQELQRCAQQFNEKLQQFKGRGAPGCPSVEYPSPRGCVFFWDQRMTPPFNANSTTQLIPSWGGGNSLM